MLASQGRIVIFQRGRYTGAKAVIVSASPNAILVVGASKVPRPVFEGMTDRAKERRSKMQVFVKSVNPKHLIYTRYTSDIKIGFEISVENLEKKKECVKKVEEVLRKAMKSENNAWLFTKLKV